LLKPYAKRFMSAYSEGSTIKGYPVKKCFYLKCWFFHSFIGR